jgi:hypothetical protein
MVKWYSGLLAMVHMTQWDICFVFPQQMGALLSGHDITMQDFITQAIEEKLKASKY